MTNVKKLSTFVGKEQPYVKEILEYVGAPMKGHHRGTVVHYERWSEPCSMLNDGVTECFDLHDLGWFPGQPLVRVRDYKTYAARVEILRDRAGNISAEYSFFRDGETTVVGPYRFLWEDNVKFVRANKMPDIYAGRLSEVKQLVWEAIQQMQTRTSKPKLFAAYQKLFASAKQEQAATDAELLYQPRVVEDDNGNIDMKASLGYLMTHSTLRDNDRHKDNKKDKTNPYNGWQPQNTLDR